MLKQERRVKQTEIGLFPEDWTVNSLSEIADFSYGKMPEKQDIVSEGYPIFSGYRITGFHKRYTSPEPKLILVARGVGGTGDIKIAPPKTFVTNLCIIFDLNKTVNLQFLYYYFHKGLRYLDSGSAQSQITISDLNRVKVALPPLLEQQSIAKMCAAIDDKIELNQSMNRTLEAIGEAVFRRWFVNFEFPNQEGKPYKSSGGEMQESEIGEIPINWAVRSLGDVLEFAYGKPLKDNDRKGGSIPVYGSNGQIGWHDERLVKGPGIIVGRKGNPGTVTWSQTDFFPIDTTFYVIPKDTASLHYLFYLLQNQDLPTLSADSAVPGLNRNIAYMNTVLIPTQEVLAQFSRLVESLKARILLNEKESNTLTTIRDTLLPKLMSGKIRVPLERQET